VKLAASVLFFKLLINDNETSHTTETFSRQRMSKYSYFLIKTVSTNSYTLINSEIASVRNINKEFITASLINNVRHDKSETPI